MATVITDLRKLGTITSIDEALDASNLNFITEQCEIVGTNGISCPNNKMLYRGDTNQFLGLVGLRYEPIQNHTAMAFVDTIIKEENAVYTEAISKDNGAVSIIKATYDRRDEVAKGDILEREIVVSNGFDAKSPLKVSFMLRRLVCLNGLTCSENDSVITFRHTQFTSDRMELSLKIMDSSHKFFDSFVATAKRMAEKAVDHQMVEKFLNGLYSDTKVNEKKRTYINELFENGKGNKGETVWDLINGVTEYHTHYCSTSPEKRAESLYFGASEKKNALAWDLAKSML